MSGISSQVKANIISPAQQYNDTHKYQSFELDITSAPNILGNYRKNEIGFIVPIHGQPPIDMALFDHNLYDFPTAQLAVETYYAQQLQRQHQYFQANKLKYLALPGLGFQVYTVPMMSTTWDANYFAKALKSGFTPVTLGNSDQFASLTKALSGYNTAGLNTQFFVEWFGYFYPPQTGRYGFTTQTGQTAYLWVGDVALTNYTLDNAVQTGNVLDQITMVQGTYYPIRIQYGSAVGKEATNALGLTITFNGAALTGEASHGQGLLFALAENTSRRAPYEPIQIHYALTQTSQDAAATNLYNLYVSPFNILNNYIYNQRVRGAKSNSNLLYSSVVLLSCSTNDPASLAIRRNGDVVLQNATSSATLVNVGTVSADTYLELRAGNLYAVNPPSTSSHWDLLSDPKFSQASKTVMQDNYAAASVNTTWSNRYIAAYNQGNVGSRLPVGASLDVSNALYSSDGMSVLYIQGNELVFLTSREPERTRQYTSATDAPRTFYLLSANGDLKLGSTMLVDTSAATLQYVPMGGNVLQYGTDFVAYSGQYSFPPNLTVADNSPNMYVKYDNMDQTECQTTCVQHPKCSHYYSYQTSDGVAHCVVDTNNDAPRYLPNNPAMGIQAAQGNKGGSTLHKRRKQINSTCKINVYEANYQTMDTEDEYLSYGSYTINYNPYDPAPDQEGPCGIPSIANSIHMFQYGSPTAPPAATPAATKAAKEGFVPGYNPTPCQSLSGPQCIQDIQNNIAVVNAAYQANQATNAEVNEKYNQLTDVIYNQFAPKYNKINGNPQYDAIDLDGRLSGTDQVSRTSLLNGMIEDVKDTMMRQNTYYILTNICAASLLVAFFALVPE